MVNTNLGEVDAIPYFTPAQNPPAGTPLHASKDDPILFKPLKLRSVTFNNRVFVSPMCMYSAQDGFLTDFHLVHLGNFALKGAGLVIVEATAVEPRGRISPEDSGLWKDEHIVPLRRITDFIHSQSTKVGIQLAHAGRKASLTAPFNGYTVATAQENGWADAVVGPSAVAYDHNHANPTALTYDEIQSIITAFGAATRRAREANFDVVEIHGAHGYLIHEFLSPLSNKRTDEYGGSFENRIRFALDVTRAVRAEWPEDKPLFFRVSATDWVDSEESWTPEQTVELAKRLKELGVDLLDISSGGNSPLQDIKVRPGFQVPFAAKVKREVPGISVGAVGIITKGRQANDILEKTEADAVLVAREFLRDSGFVLRAARDIGVDVKWPAQYERAKAHF